MKQTENILQRDNKSNNLLLRFKNAYSQYKNDLIYVKNTSRMWKQKPYIFLLTELSILWHNLYWRVIKTI